MKKGGQHEVPIVLRQDPWAPWPGRHGTATVAALGDLMLAGEWDEVGRRGGLAKAFAPLAEVLAAADLRFANLEATVAGSDGTIAKEPRVIGELSTVADSLSALAIDLVSVANNHTFDAYWSGFARVEQRLTALGIPHVGAGADAAAAARPIVVERRGIRFGWLAFAATDTRPSHLAIGDSYGVNPLVAETALAAVADLASRVEHVLVSVHWGVEFCHLPSPAQIRLARRLIDQGASLVIGHHAHVIQGVEAYGGGVIAYNLGNATTTDLAIGGRLAIRQTAVRRRSFVLRATFGRERLEAIELVPFSAPRGRIVIGDAAARRLVAKVGRQLADGVSDRRWKAVRLYEDVFLRTVRKLDPRVIGSVRPRHFSNFFRNLANALRGRGPA